MLGPAWEVLTVAFQFFMDLVLEGRSFAEALMANDVLAGRVWVFLLPWIARAPLLFYRSGVAKTGRGA